MADTLLPIGEKARRFFRSAGGWNWPASAAPIVLRQQWQLALILYGRSIWNLTMSRQSCSTGTPRR